MIEISTAETVLLEITTDRNTSSGYHPISVKLSKSSDLATVSIKNRAFKIYFVEQPFKSLFKDLFVPANQTEHAIEASLHEKTSITELNEYNKQ